MGLDGAEVGAELHLRDLHVALGVEDDGGLGVDVQVVDLEPDVPVPVQGEQAHDQTGQVVPGVTLHSNNQTCKRYLSCLLPILHPGMYNLLKYVVKHKSAKLL